MQHRLHGWSLAALTVLTLAAAPMTVRAQTPPTPPPAAPGQPVLSPAQQARAMARQQKFQKDIVALQANKTLTPAQKTVKGQAMYKAMDADMLAILTPQQRADVLKQRSSTMQRQQAFLKAHGGEIAQGKAATGRLNKSLTPQQKAQIAAIRKQLNDQGRQLQANTSLTPQAKQQQFLADRRQADAKTLALLTPAQRADYQKIKQLQQQLATEAGAAPAH